MEVKKVLVTGSEGYIGSVLTSILLENGFEVVGFDSLYYERSADKKNKQYELIKGDVRNTQSIPLKGIDAIIHLAALSNDPMGELSPELTENINYQASISLAKRAKSEGIKRFIFASSCSVYGIAESGVVDETSKTNPLTAYAKSKIMTEDALKKLCDDTFFVGLMRNSTVFGYSPNFRSDLVVNNFITTALATGKIKVMSDGSPWRPLIDVRDLAEIKMKFLTADWKSVNGEIINVGFEENNFQVKDLLDEVKKQLPECEVVYTGEHGSDTRSYRVNFDKLHKLIPGITRNWPLEKSVTDMISKLKANGFCSEDFENEKYIRIAALKELLVQNKLDENLYWK